LAWKTSIVIGTYNSGDTEATGGSIAEAINAVTTAAVSVHAVATARIGEHGGKPYMMAVILWKNA